MPYQILSDVHTHTLFSRHAYSTLAEDVAAAQKLGLELLGISDHFSIMSYRDQFLYNFQYLYNMGCWPRDWDGVTVLRGCEADILDYDGTLFGEKEIVTENIVGRPFPEPRPLLELATQHVDYVIASVHDPVLAAEATLAQATEMYVKALDKKEVLILGHTGRAGAKYDLDTVLLHAKEKHKLIEINEHSFDLGIYDEVCTSVAEHCAELGVGITVSSDAHIAHDIGRYPRAIEMLEEIHFPEELIMNRDRDTFLAALEAGGCYLH
ncbi:PHP domain-containing protein [Collinsella provencensis]|uniref:PHP domain-containing protein n=1 Tax=Collinsella provencensis TaxID=1937461 RepID=UPI000C822985|nr:PHP domain-containing protein [Collinsella provencensis]